MRAIVDKRSNLCRGFADVHTPSVVENELLYNWQEKKEDLTSRIENLNILIRNTRDQAQLKHLKTLRSEATKAREALGRKINKRLDLNTLIIDRLKQACSEEVFSRACALAREDKKRILEQLPVEE